MTDTIFRYMISRFAIYTIGYQLILIWAYQSIFVLGLCVLFHVNIFILYWVHGQDTFLLVPDDRLPNPNQLSDVLKIFTVNMEKDDDGRYDPSYANYIVAYLTLFNIETIIIVVGIGLYVWLI